MGCRNSTIQSEDEGGYSTFDNKDAPENRQYTAVESVAETCPQNVDKSTTKNSDKDKTGTKDRDSKNNIKKEKSRQGAHIPYTTEGSNNEGGAKHLAVQTDIKEQKAFMSTEHIVIEQNKNAMAVNGNGKNSAEDFKNQATEKKTTVNDNQNINTKDNDTNIKERTQFDKLTAENEERNTELQQLKDQLQERNDKIKQLKKKIKTSERDMDEKNLVKPERNRLKQERDELKTQLDKLRAENQEQNKELQQLKDQLQKGNDKIKQLEQTNTELEEEVKQTQDRCNKTLERRKEKSSQHAHITYTTEGSTNEEGAKHHAVQTDIKQQTAFTSTGNIVIEQNKNAMAVNGNGKNSAEDFKNQATEKKTKVNDNQNINTKDDDTKIKERTQFDKLTAENEERNTELQQLKDQLQERNDKIKQLKKKIKTSERDMDEKNLVRPERNRLKQERDELKTQLDKLRAENQEQNKELQQLKDQLQKGNDKIKQLKQTNTELEEEVKQTQDRCNKTLERRSNKKMNREKDELQKKFTDFKREANKQIEKLNQELNVLAKEKDKALAIKMNELKVVQNEKNDLLLRLSEMTGRRLTDNNANIADLSDQNRPTKLAEKYAELYDNEWTDAFSYLQTIDVSKDSEKRIIEILLTILVEAFTLSTETAEKQLDTVRKTLEDFYGKKSHNRDQVQDLIKKLKDHRKKVTQPSMDLEKEYKVTISRKIKDLQPTSLESDAFKPFVQKCLELCWLMAIQDPPLYLTLDNCKTGQIFNRNNFKEYTKSGPYIDFVVWPSVFLEKDGPLLCKGVVQCKKSNSFQLRSKDGSQTGQRLAKSMYSKDTTVTLTSTLSLDSEKCNKSSSLTNTSQVDDQSGNTKL